jgi:hypothetical protein
MHLFSKLFLREIHLPAGAADGCADLFCRAGYLIHSEIPFPMGYTRKRIKKQYTLLRMKSSYTQGRINFVYTPIRLTLRNRDEAQHAAPAGFHV